VALVKHDQPDARVVTVPTDCYPRPYPPIELYLPYGLVRRRLGIKLPDHKIRADLSALGFQAKERHAGVEVKVPSWRATKDIELPEDLLEEIGRMEGYDKLKPMPPIAPLSPKRPRPIRTLERMAATVLSMELGYAEVKHRSFYGARDAARIGLGEVEHLAVRNPSSDEHDRMILTAAPYLLRTVHRNQTREPRGRIWENARVFSPHSGTLPLEVPVLALGSWDRDGADEPAGALFLGVIADVRSLLARLGTGPCEVVNVSGAALREGLPTMTWLHPGRQAELRIGDQVLGVVGEVLPSIMREFDLEGRCVVAELETSALIACMRAQSSTYEPVLRFPVVPFDVAVITPTRTPAADVCAVIEEAVPGSIRELRVFDVYEGKGIPEGQRSLALRCELFDRERTLDGAAADALRAAVISAIEARGWTVRKV
jgi:phenylalanyl-tRNA synthetase beta chain